MTSPHVTRRELLEISAAIGGTLAGGQLLPGGGPVAALRRCTTDTALPHAQSRRVVFLSTRRFLGTADTVRLLASRVLKPLCIMVSLSRAKP